MSVKFRYVWRFKNISWERKVKTDRSNYPTHMHINKTNKSKFSPRPRDLVHIVFLQHFFSRQARLLKVQDTWQVNSGQSKTKHDKIEHFSKANQILTKYICTYLPFWGKLNFRSWLNNNIIPIPKGKLISEGNFGVFKSPQKWTFFVRDSALASEMGKI